MSNGGMPVKRCRQCKLFKSWRSFARGEGGDPVAICIQCTRPTEKRCSQCKTVKPIDAFYANYSAADMHMSSCKVCQNESNRKLRLLKGNRGIAVREKSWELAETRIAAMQAQARNPDADYHAHLSVVAGPLIFGGASDAMVVSSRLAAAHALVERKVRRAS